MKTFAKRIIGLVLALAIVAGFVPVTGPLDITANAATVNHEPVTQYIQDGVTLHCWNWSIANIRANLGLIANSGYSAIQLSPMQELKEATINKPYDNWWVVYQPISFNINTKADHAVGTKSELIELCNEAHKYGLKVIMDVVCNHTANGGTANTLCAQADPDLLNDPDCWHDYRTNSWDYSDRYNITQYCMAGLPDLNTGNKKVQQKALAMLKEYIDCGVDGFRWDAAKQIETPNDVYCASDFWPTVINGANEYASSTRGIWLYHYGELLENADTKNSLHISAYTQYMSVTESVWSNDVRYRLEDHNASGLRKSYFKETSADKLVLWAESHDTFGDKSSIYSTQYNLDKAWSLVTSRAYTMALFFPRANDMLYQEMGELAKVSWTSKLTTAVNKFHNHFAGQSECLTQDSGANLYYNERGNSGVIITNFNDGSRDINLPVYTMASGTYYDQITGNQFTVSNGRIYGTMGDTGVAVVYNPGTKSCSHSSHGSDGYCYSCFAYVGHKSGTKCSTCGTASTRTIYFNNTAGWSTPYIYGWHDNGGTGTAAWPGVKMTKVEGSIYKATVPTTATNVIFHDNNGTQTANITPSADADIYHYNTGFWTSSTGEDESAVDYYLFGWINGADYGTGDDYANLGKYKFVNGTLIATFDADSYIGVKTNDNTWYMTQQAASGTKATLYNTTTGACEKMMVPGGVQLTFTLKKNMDGTLTLSYTTVVCDHSYTSKVTTAAGCTTTGVRTYTCSRCGYSYTETIAAAGHKFSGTLCTVCGYDTNCKHNYSKVINRQPTCSATGLATYTCSKCGDSYSETLATTAHSYSGGKCSVCGTLDSSYKPDYYLFGYINGANYGCEGDYQTLGQYKFVNGKLTATFEQDSYVGVKTGDNVNWYMTNGWLGDATSATLYNSEINANPDKLFVPGGTQLTFTLKDNGDGSLELSYQAKACSHNYSSSITRYPGCTAAGEKTYTCSKCGSSYTESIAATGHSFSGGKCTVCGAVDTGYKVDYYLFGFINGANYGCEDDHANVGIYQFVNGKLTASFEQDSYVGVKTADNANWYMTNGWQGTDVTSATLYNTSINANPDKLFVPGGCEVTFTLTDNGNDTLVLSYETAACDHSYTAKTTAATCTDSGVKTYTCSKCGYHYSETIPATGHKFVSGKCSVCGAKDAGAQPKDYYLFGFINGANYGCEDDHANLGKYKFVNGKLTASFEQDSYVGVKTADNAGWYMTNGWQGTEATSATLYSTDVNANPDKLFVPGGCEITFTLTDNGNGTLTLSYVTAGCSHQYGITASVAATCLNSGSRTYACSKCGNSYTETVPATGHTYKDEVIAPTCENNGYTRHTCITCGYFHSTDAVFPTGHTYMGGKCTNCGQADPSAAPKDYYLFGFINGANYGCEDDWENLGQYKFLDGKLTATFDTESYVGVKTSDNAGWYMTDGWQGVDVTSVKLYSTDRNANPDKFYVPSGVQVTFTLKANPDGSLTLSYVTAQCSHEYSSGVTAAATCTADGIRTYSCTKCSHSYTESIPATGHNYVAGYCAACGTSMSGGSGEDVYYLMGYINGADYGWGSDMANLGAYKFVNGKVTVTFTEDSYVAVKTGDNAKFYMTNGYEGEVSSTTLYLFSDPYAVSANKMLISGGQTVTFTLEESWDGTLKLSYTADKATCKHPSHNQDGICSNCGSSVPHEFSHGVCSICRIMDSGYEAYDYYLFGYINGANYGCEEDWANLGFFKFRSIGTCSANFTSNSYVGVKKVNPGTGEVVGWYMTNGWQGTDKTSATLYNSVTLGGNADKLYAPAGVRLTFTLEVNDDGTLTLSYADVNCSHTFDGGKVTTAAGCGTEGTVTYTCTNCGHYYTETVAAVGHTCSNGKCTACGAKDPNSCCTKHSYTIDYEILASCGENGSRVFKASCGATYSMTLPATGHSYNSRVTTAATCVLPGLKSYTCSCGDTYSEPISALGHQYQNGICKTCGAKESSGNVTETAYYLFGYINGADYGCGDDWENLGEYKFVGDQLTATFEQDSYIGIKTGDNGSWYMTESFVDGKTGTFYDTATGVYEKMFVPGGVSVTFTLVKNADGSLKLSYTTASAGGSVILPNFTLKYPSMSFKDEVKLNIYFDVTDMDSVVDMGLIVFSSKVDSYTVYNAEDAVSGYQYSSSAGLYVVSTNGIPAKNMGDTVWFAVYAQLSNGTYTYSKLVDYSPKTYAYTMLGSGDAKLDALLVAMLNYGTAAQTYFGYNTSNLLNNQLTSAQKALVTGYNSSMMPDIAAPSASKQGSFASNGGFEDKYPSVTFGGAFAINYYCVPSYVPANGVTMYYWREADYNAAGTLTTGNATGSLKMTGSGTYRGSVTGISAKDISDGVYVAFVYSDGTTTYSSGVLPYSIGMYCTTMASYQNDFTPFAQATAVYGYYAKQYFG